jgi:heme O synthase-like polyprenyltransferase
MKTTKIINESSGEETTPATTNRTVPADTIKIAILCAVGGFVASLIVVGALGANLVAWLCAVIIAAGVVIYMGLRPRSPHEDSDDVVDGGEV